ncbi:MAG TPA: hypothetical protein VI010_15720 [Xanthobacteraceae bacterium]
MRWPTSRQKANQPHRSSPVSGRQPKRSSPQRLEREGRQHVKEILVRDAEAAVNGIHPGDGAFAQVGVEAVLDDGGEDQIRVVIAPLRPPFELAGGVQYARDPRARESAKQRELERARDVPREVVASEPVGDRLAALRAGQGRHRSAKGLRTSASIPHT